MHKFAAFSESAVVAALTDALDPGKQYYRQLERYRRGDREPELLRRIASTARTFREQETARRVVTDFLRELSDSALYTRENLRFVARFTEHTADPGFRVFLENSQRVNQAVGADFYAEDVVDRAITADEISPHAFPEGRASAAVPQWGVLHAEIARKYGQHHAERVVLFARLRWNEERKNWRDFEQDALVAFARYGSLMSLGTRNSISWSLFGCSSNAEALTEAIKMTEPVTRDSTTRGLFWAMVVDTYANLLYKVGRRAEAIDWETKAAAAVPGETWARETLAKMQAGEPTWPASCEG